MDIKNNYMKWLTTIEDTDLKNQLIAMTEQEIESAFYKDLEFGTGGLRGIMGAGTNRINIYTVNKTTQGICNYLINKKKTPSIAIAFDNRAKSELFARSAAGVIAANGAQAYIFPELMSPAVLSYAASVLECDASIVITASDNPAEYNGCKVYGKDGYQITRLVAESIERCIQKVDIFEGVKKEPFANAVQKSKVHFVSQDLLKRYHDNLDKCSVDTETLKEPDFKAVYSPFNEVQKKPVNKILSKAVFEKTNSVPKQKSLVENPVFKMPIQLVENSQANSLLATYISGNKNKIAVEIKTALQTSVQQKKDIDEINSIICNIEEVKQEFNAASSRFDFQDDPDLAECCIYEMKALAAKYRYFLKEVHRLGITNNILKGTHASLLSQPRWFS